MRASVVPGWTERLSDANHDILIQLVCFNEAIDQVASEATAWHVDRVEESRSLLLGMLGHDRRNPLGAVSNSATCLQRTDGLTGDQNTVCSRILTSAIRMQRIIRDLLDISGAGGA